MSGLACASGGNGVKLKGSWLLAITALIICGHLSSFAETTGNSVAVVFGVRDYHHRDIPTVEYAINDAAAIFDLLVTSLGYVPENIIYEENPTTARFLTVFGTSADPDGQLHDWITPEQSDVFVYYSGHGATDPDTGAAFLVPSDADPRHLSLSAYPLELLKKNLMGLGARSVTLVLDSCFSGISDAGPIVPGLSPVAVLPTEEMSALPHGLLLTSASGSEVSTWYPKVQHSLFTFFLLKGLYGAADTEPADRNVTVDELEQYLTKEVPRAARRYGREQTPQVLASDRERVLLQLTRQAPVRLKRLEELEDAPAPAASQDNPAPAQFPGRTESAGRDAGTPVAIPGAEDLLAAYVPLVIDLPMSTLGPENLGGWHMVDGVEDIDHAGLIIQRYRVKANKWRGRRIIVHISLEIQQRLSQCRAAEIDLAILDGGAIVDDTVLNIPGDDCHVRRSLVAEFDRGAFELAKQPVLRLTARLLY